MAGLLEGLQPEKVFYYFEEISKIPRGSTHEKKVSDYLWEWAKGKKFEVIRDEALNILIKKPGTPGYENAPTVVLQGHMDMVWEKNQDTIHDFFNDPLKLRIVEDYIYASGTTLGADNGIGVALAQAILDSSDIPHPPLEVLITTDEENGLTGMNKFDAKRLSGRILINVDNEEEGVFTAGCAGGGRIFFYIPVHKAIPKYKQFYKLSIKGLKGGHSGNDIDKERGNSIKLLGRILYDIKDNIEIAELSGGAKANAIPRESWAVLSVKDGFAIEDSIRTWNDTLKYEFAFSDANVQVTIERLGPSSEVLVHNEVYQEEIKETIIHLISLIPNGPLMRDLEHNLVVYSNNLGVISTNDSKISFECCPRSSVKSLFRQLLGISEQIARVLQIQFEANAFYPSWEYAKESKIRDLFVKTYEELYGIQGKVNVIHAGLECGFLVERIPGIDGISIGPNMYDIHSPNEHLSISSVQRTFRLLCEVLKKLK
jgi:dipeptidase D